MAGKSPYWHIRTAFLVFFLLIAMGTIGYALIEKLPLLQALYMTMITISTVGYREIGKPSTGGQIFTMFMIVCSLATVVYMTTSIVELILEGRILNVMGRRKALRELEELTGHYVICGYGRVGKQVALECKARGTPVVIVENDHEIADSCTEDGFLVVIGDATEEAVLKRAGLERARGLVTALSSDADNLFVTMSARIIRPDVFIVGRCNSDETESKLYRAGADRAISPHNVGGKRMAALLLKPLICDFLDVVTRGQMVELILEDIHIGAGSPVVGRSLRDVIVEDLRGIGVLGLKRPKSDFLVNPRGDTVLYEGDILIITGSSDQVDRLRQLSAGTS